MSEKMQDLHYDLLSKSAGISTQVCSAPRLTHRRGSWAPLLLSGIELWPAVNTFDYDKKEKGRAGNRKAWFVRECVQRALLSSLSVDLRTRSVSLEMPHIGWVGYSAAGRRWWWWRLRDNHWPKVTSDLAFRQMVARISRPHHRASS